MPTVIAISPTSIALLRRLAGDSSIADGYAKLPKLSPVPTGGNGIVFWALEQWREKWLTIGRNEGRAEGLAKGKAETEQHYETWLEKVARDKGIPLTELLPPSEGYVEGFSEGVATGYAAAKREFDKQLARVTAEKGITLNDLPQQ